HALTHARTHTRTPQTAELIHNNTTHWMHQNMHILQNHYTSQISSLLQTTSPYNNTAFQIASRWAWERVRLSDTTLTTAHRALSPLTSPNSVTQTTSHTTPNTHSYHPHITHIGGAF